MRWLLLGVFLFEFCFAKEAFTSKDIMQYLNSSNPYMSTLQNDELVAKERVKLKQTPFDTLITGKYEHKDYPASEGKYEDIGIKKTMQNGLELSVAYRKSEGVQEYNNIKTSDQGEVLVGAKVSLMELAMNTNTKKTQLDVALIESIKYRYATNDRVRLLYLNVLNHYYQVVYSRTLLKIERSLLQKALLRQGFIQKRVALGSRAQIDLLEVEQQVINRKQRVRELQNEFANQLNIFLKYLNISKERFFAKYTLLEELQSGIELITLDEALQTALQNRADLKMLSSEKDGLLRQKKNVKLFLYPKVNFALYGAHDFKYDNGFKAALDFSFPIERSLYESKNAQYMQRLSNIEKQREKKLLDIKISLTNTINSLQTLKETLDYASKELELAKKMENAEKKRFELGGGTLFVLNQREMNTLNIEKKLLYYKLTYLLLQEQLQNSMGLLH